LSKITNLHFDFDNKKHETRLHQSLNAICMLSPRTWIRSGFKMIKEMNKTARVKR